MGGFLRGRVFRHGTSSAIAVLLVLGILGIVNFLASRYAFRVDTTRDKIHTLSDQSLTLLRSLDEDVEVIAFFTEEDVVNYRRVLRNYAHASRHFSYRIVDPDKYPSETRRYDVRRRGISVVTSGVREERIFGEAERDLTNAIAKAVRDRGKVIYLLDGHGERKTDSVEPDGFHSAGQALRELNYDLRDTLRLASGGSVPSDCDLLVVAAPRTPLLEAEVDTIRSYLAAGGAALFLLEPEIKTGLEPMLAHWNIGLSDDFVVDEGGMRLSGQDHSVPVAVGYGSHPITWKHKGLMTFFPRARSVEMITERPSLEFTRLVKTSSASWRETDFADLKPTFDPASDSRGPVSLAVAVRAAPMKTRDWGKGAGKRKTQIVAFGDADFASTRFFPSMGNGDLFLNSVNWLLEEGDLIGIRARQKGVSRIHLTKQDVQHLLWLSLIVLPGIPFVAGLIVWRSRRS